MSEAKDTTRSDEVHTVSFFRSSNPDDRSALNDLLRSNDRIVRYDRIEVQLQELIRTRDPSYKFTDHELRAAVDEILQKIPRDEYGVWVYYPWTNRLVHLLDEEEFIQVRTDRNRNKITREQQRELSTRKVGVIGLSVGQSVSLTMVLERSFGEIRLADHDTLELSNLNRIRNGVHQMGVNKAVNVAREILEIDPFLKVTCYTGGINEGNIEEFLTHGGKLDVLIEECDSVAIKVLARQKARSHRIPVIMDTSDRGMIDVERFDREPARPIFHGRLDHIAADTLKPPIDEHTRMSVSKAIVGVDQISGSLRSSLPLIGKELITWPQLATGVTLGGAAAADVARRIMLKENIPSGRSFVDLEELIPNERPLHTTTEDESRAAADHR